MTMVAAMSYLDMIEINYTSQPSLLYFSRLVKASLPREINIIHLVMVLFFALWALVTLSRGALRHECPTVSKLYDSENSLREVIESVRHSEFSLLGYLDTSLKVIDRLALSNIPTPAVPSAALTQEEISVFMGIFREYSTLDPQALVSIIIEKAGLPSQHSLLNSLLSFSVTLEKDLKLLPNILRTLESDLKSISSSLESEYAPCIDKLEYDIAILHSRIKRLTDQRENIERKFPELSNGLIVQDISLAINSHYFAPIDSELSETHLSLKNKERLVDEIRLLQERNPLSLV